MNQDDYVVDPQTPPQVGLDIFQPAPEPTDIKEPVQPKTSWGKGFQTALAERNWVTSSLIGASNFLDTLSEVTQAPADEVFNPIQDQYLNLVPVEYRHLLGSARSEGEVYRQAAMINQHIDNQNALKTAPISAQLVAGGVDVFTTPWYLFTIGRALRSAKIGTEILKSAGRAGAEFGIAEAINEAVLHKSQITRTPAESIANVGLATTIGGLFGGVGGAIRSADSALLKKMVSETLQGKKVKFKLNKNFDIEGLNIYDDSAGAMRVQSIDMPGSRLLGWGKAGKLRPARPFIWMLGKWARNPVILGLSSKSPTVVWFTSHTYEHNMDVVKNVFQGSNLVQSLQTKLYEWEARGKLASIKMNRFYAEYLGLNPNNPLRNALKRAPKDKLSKSDFERLVMAAMAGDEKIAADVAGHEVMNRAKKELYEEFYEPVSAQLKELGFLAPDVTPAMATQYINRIYDQHWLQANPVKAQEFLLKEYTETNTKVVAVREQETILKDQIENLKTLIGEAVDKDAIKQLEEQSRELKAQLKAVQDDIQERVLKGEFSPDMLTGEYGMTGPQIEELKALREPLELNEAQIKVLREDLQKLGTLKNLKEFFKQNVSGISSGALSDVATSIEKFGINKTLKAIRAYKSQIIVAEKQVKAQAASYRDKISAGIKEINSLKAQKNEKQLAIKQLEAQIAAAPKNEKKLIKSYKNELAKTKESLKNIPRLIEDIKKQNKIYQKEIAGIRDARELITISKESAGEALPFVEKAIKELSEKELDQQIAIIEKGVKDINRKALLEAKKQRNVIRREIKSLKEKNIQYKTELQNRMATKEGGLLAIDEDLYYMTKAGEYKLKDIDYGTIRLRPIMDETQLMTSAEDTYKTLTNQTEEQLLDTILGSAKIGSGGENPFMPRTLMIDDKKLYMGNFLSSDFSSTVRTFSLRAGRLIEMRKLMNAYGITDKSILNHLVYKIEQEYSAIRKQVARKQQAELAGLTGKELEKATLRHEKENLIVNKDLARDLKLIEITYKRITGTMPQSRKELMQLARMSNNYAYATQLGALSLLQIQDLVAPIFNHGVTRWMKDGVGGFVSAIAVASKKDKERIAAWMSDINVGIETEAALYGLANDVRDSVQFASGWLDTKLAKAATAMGILNFSSAAGNLVTRINAHVSMSDALRRLSRFMDGTIGKSDAIALGNLGLRDKRIAAVILDQYNKHGEKIGLSYIPGWEKWGSTETDMAYQKLCLEARKTFMDAISKDIRSTIFTGTNIATYPLELNPNDATRAFMVYMGWILSASTNYAVPLLQRYDQNRVNGAIAMWAAACLVEPLRALIDGREPDLDPAKVFKKGILNSGVLGLPVALANTANSMGRLLPDLLVDRYANRDRGLQISAGAPQMLLEAGLNLGGQFLNDDWNQKELKQLAATIPLARAIGFRKIVNEAIKATDLKERPERGN